MALNGDVHVTLRCEEAARVGAVRVDVHPCELHQTRGYKRIYSLYQTLPLDIILLTGSLALQVPAKQANQDCTESHSALPCIEDLQALWTF